MLAVPCPLCPHHCPVLSRLPCPVCWGVSTSLLREQSPGSEEGDLGITFPSFLAPQWGNWETCAPPRLPKFCSEMEPRLLTAVTCSLPLSTMVFFLCLFYFLTGASWSHFLNKLLAAESCYMICLWGTQTKKANRVEPSHVRYSLSSGFSRAHFIDTTASLMRQRLQIS